LRLAPFPKSRLGLKVYNLGLRRVEGLGFRFLEAGALPKIQVRVQDVLGFRL